MKIGNYTDDEILEFMTEGEGRGFLGRSMFDAMYFEIERLNNIIKKLERLVDDYAWNSYYIKCGNRYLKSEILNDIREIMELKGSNGAIPPEVMGTNGEDGGLFDYGDR